MKPFVFDADLFRFFEVLKLKKVVELERGAPLLPVLLTQPPSGPQQVAEKVFINPLFHQKH